MCAVFASVCHRIQIPPWLGLKDSGGCGVAEVNVVGPHSSAATGEAVTTDETTQVLLLPSPLTHRGFGLPPSTPKPGQLY